MSPASSACRQRGVSMVEAATATAILSVALVGLASLLHASDGLIRVSRAAVRAQAESRRNVDALAEVLRGVDLGTWEEAPEEGSDVLCAFRRVEGRAGSTIVRSGVETIVWRPTTAVVPGVPRPGRLVLVTETGERVVSERVPHGGCRVVRSGRWLTIEVSTWHYEQRPYLVSNRTAVCARNG